MNKQVMDIALCSKRLESLLAEVKNGYNYIYEQLLDIGVECGAFLEIDYVKEKPYISPKMKVLFDENPDTYESFLKSCSIKRVATDSGVEYYKGIPGDKALLTLHLIDALLDKLKTYEYDVEEVDLCLQTIKRAIFVIFPYGRNSQYYRYQGEDYDFYGGLEQISSEGNIEKSYYYKKGLMENILNIYLLHDVNKAIKFYKTYKNIFDFTPSKFYQNYVETRRNGEQNYKLNHLEFFLSELKVDSNYNDEYLLEGFEQTINRFQEACISFYTKPVFKENINVNSLISFSKLDLTKFYESEEENEAFLVLNDTFKNVEIDNQIVEIYKEYHFVAFVKALYDSSGILLNEGLIDKQIFNLIYIINNEYKAGRSLLNKSAIDGCISLITDYIYQNLKNLTDDENNRLFSMIFKLAKSYLDSNHIMHKYSHNRVVNDRNMINAIYSIKNSEEELRSRISNDNRFYSILCSIQKAFMTAIENRKKDILDIPTDYSILFMPLVKLVERYLKEYLCRNYGREIYKITLPGSKERALDNQPVNAEELSHKAKSFDLSAASLAIQYLFNKYRTNDITIFTGLAEVHGRTVKFYNSNLRVQDNDDLLKKSTLAIPIFEFKEYIRNGFMHIDVTTNFSETMELYSAVCYWFIKCLDDCGTI